MKQRAVQPGQLYRSVETGLFGRSGREWQVMSLAPRNDGMTYAMLAMTEDPSKRKTLAMNVLLDRRLYKMVADAPAVDPPLS
jgi:hypothetical protein